MKSVLLDSDVLLHFLEARQPFFEDAQKIMHLAATRVIAAYTTPLIVANIYYILRRKVEAPLLRGTLSDIMQYVPALSMDNNIVNVALQSDFADFEDALQHEAALISGKVEVILTRNGKDYKKAKLPAMTRGGFLLSHNS